MSVKIRTLAAVPTAVLLFVLVGCGGSDSADSAPASADSAQGTDAAAGEAGGEKKKEEPPLTGDVKARAEKAAQSAVPGTVVKSEEDAEKPGMYAVEIKKADGSTVEAWVRPANGPYLDPWHTRLRDAYLATMADLGVTKDLDEHEFLAAMKKHKDADPASAAVLSAIKATVKGGIGKLRERPQGTRYRPGERWPALERPTWRPDIRAAVVAAARVNMHRKMLKTARMSALFPLAVLSDCVVYPSPGPSPLDVLPHEDGKPVAGAFRLGVSPGMVKHEGTRPMSWAVELLEQGFNPARHIKGGDSVLDEGE